MTKLNRKKIVKSLISTIQQEGGDTSLNENINNKSYFLKTYNEQQVALDNEYQFDQSDGVFIHVREKNKNRQWLDIKDQIQLSYIVTTNKILKKTKCMKKDQLRLFSIEGRKRNRKNDSKEKKTPTKTLSPKDEKTNDKSGAKKNAKLAITQGTVPDTERKRPMLRAIKKRYLAEQDWYFAKYEREVGTFPPRQNVPTRAEVDKALLKRVKLKRYEIENYLYDQFREKPLPKDIPKVTWEGPLLKRCGCMREDCDCKGDILLPSKLIPIAVRPSWKLSFFLQWLTGIKVYTRGKPEKNFAQRLHQKVKAEQRLYNTLEERGILKKRGAEFCPYRCLHYNMPLAKETSAFFALKKRMLEAFEQQQKSEPILEPEPEREPPMKEESKLETVEQKVEIEEPPTEVVEPVTEVVEPTVEEVEPAREEIEEEFEEEEEEEGIINPCEVSFYVDKATQYPRVDENGEFILEDYSHILWPRTNYMCHLEGWKIRVDNYVEPTTEEQEPLRTRLKNIFSAQSLKNRLSSFTSSLFSKLLENVEYEYSTEPPANDQWTQDPPLDDDYVSIINIYQKPADENDTCPCCQIYKTNILEGDTVCEDLPKNTGSQGTIKSSQASINKQQLKSCCTTNLQSFYENVTQNCNENMVSSYANNIVGKSVNNTISKENMETDKTTSNSISLTKSMNINKKLSNSKNSKEYNMKADQNISSKVYSKENMNKNIQSKEVILKNNINKNLTSTVEISLVESFCDSILKGSKMKKLKQTEKPLRTKLQIKESLKRTPGVVSSLIKNSATFLKHRSKTVLNEI